MRVAHLILTYTDPLLTERLIKKIAHPDFDFYIHVDLKFSIESYLHLADLPNVYLIKNREDVRWAGYNTIKATFNCVREIVETGIKYDFINFLSGQDYAVKPVEYMVDFFKNNTGKQFIRYQNAETTWTEGQSRVSRYHFVNFKFKGKYRLEWLINLLRRPRRHLPQNLTMWGKAMFWMLSADCAMYVVERVEGSPELQKFLKYTWGSDEFVFQTILMDSPFREALVNDDYRYIDWSKGGAHPKTLTVNDFDKIMQSDALFARKFSTSVDIDIIDKLDKL
ncbi:glycosyl transferase [Mucilaginibacter sp. JRF]|uniref:beta-1,6-N-acetylglucosaminyltransferase n=1 Tax=Mucilaginibacter sp. JRF TaxID=2780088 RepID=UPI00188078E7|nr:beta-1,6-N-acetylglucosaminyltransferase [Mucilaginibacter sp. JRF]MBE9585140.1 glycosyl transferase [Mucilaginibacter sp. JRF]